MGTLITAVCSKCGYEKKLFTGGGMADCFLETKLNALPSSKRQILSEAVEKGAEQISIDRKPCSCISCGEIYAVPVVSFFLKGKMLTVSGECPSCGHSEYGTPERCPRCKAEITLDSTGLWD